MFLLNILLAIAWSALTGQFSPGDLAFGFVLGYAILWSLRRQLRGERYFTKVPQVIYFVAYVAWQIILANLNVSQNSAVYAKRADPPRHCRQSRSTFAPMRRSRCSPI
jgi:multisubunit Na+/H+ antiporter MnhE subunit